jgi:uncharacterized protein (TIGR02246 family)
MGVDAVRDLYAELIRAWNAQDAHAFAELFTEHGTSIGFDGSQATGAEIAEHVGAVFEDHRTAAYVAKVKDVRAAGADTAVLRALVGMVPPGESELNPETNAIQSLVAERQGETWRIVLFQNTPAQYHGRPEMGEEHTAEVEAVRSAGATVS